MKKILCVLAITILFSTIVFAKEKTFTKEATEVVPASQSQDQVIAYLTQKLTREATEEAGTFITSELNIKNYEITKDEFTSFAGAISKVKVENKETFTKNNQQYVKVKLNVTVDTDNVKTYLEKIMQDNEYKKEAEELRQKNLELEKQLKTATKQQYEKELSVQVKQQVELQKKQELAIEKLTLKAKEEYAKAKEEQDKKTAEREKEILELKNQIAQEQNNIKKAELENQARIKELENKAKTEMQKYNTKKSAMSIQKATEEINGLRKQISEIISKFENLIKTNRDNLTKSYDEQIKLSVNEKPRGKWETPEQYEERISKNVVLKETLEKEKNDNILEYNIKTVSSMIETLKPFQKRLKDLQSGKFYGKNKETVKVLKSNDDTDIDMSNKVFYINVKYKKQEHRLDFNFYGMDMKKVQLIYETLQQFLIEPLFSINKDIQPELVGFFGKHLGTNIQRNWNLQDIKIEDFDEVKEIEKYKELLKSLKKTKLMVELNSVRKNNTEYLKVQDEDPKHIYYTDIRKDKRYKEMKNFIDKYLIDLQKANILDKENYINMVKIVSKKIVAIDTGGQQTVALRADGTVVYTTNEDWITNIKNWKDIVAISISQGSVTGLKKDGTVVNVRSEYVEPAKIDIDDWKDIVAISDGRTYISGLKKDGTVVACGENDSGQCNVGDWKDIVSIIADDTKMIGLTKYGKIVVTPLLTVKEDGQIYVNNTSVNEVIELNRYKFFIFVYSGFNGIKGINVDGFIVDKLNYYNDVWGSNNKNIVSFEEDDLGFNSVALKIDGTVISYGKNKEGQCDVSDWKDIVAISMGSHHTIGLKSDGTVVAAGGRFKYDGKITYSHAVNVDLLMKD